MVCFMTQPLPRYVTSALVEEGPGWVTVTWGLGDVIPGEVEYFGYGVDYFGLDGNGGKRFGVRFHEKPSAHVFEWSGATEANYEPDSIAYDDDRLVVRTATQTLGYRRSGRSAVSAASTEPTCRPGCRSPSSLDKFAGRPSRA